MSYFSDTEITDLLILPFKTSNATLWNAVLARTERMVVDIAEQHGVLERDIADPLCAAFKDIMRAYFCWNICLDATEVANLDQGIQDKYMGKFQLYKALYEQGKKSLTLEMIIGNVKSRGDRSRSGVLYHG